jgi:hypothetical protein
MIILALGICVGLRKLYVLGEGKVPSILEYDELLSYPFPWRACIENKSDRPGRELE